MADHSMNMSSAMSTGYMMQTTGEPMTERQTEAVYQAGEAVRESYLKIFAEQSQRPASEADWWRQQFWSAAMQLASSIREQSGINECPSTTDLTIAANGQVFTVKPTTAAVLIGRYPGCEVEFPMNTGTSRVNGVLIPLPEKNQYLMVDVGSFFGIQTLKRTSDYGLVSTQPYQRPLLIFDWNETAVFQMGNLKVAVNPLECVICYDHPRETKLPCGHHLSCYACTRALTTCPICRADVDQTLIKGDYGVHTMGSLPH